MKKFITLIAMLAIAGIVSADVVIGDFESGTMALDQYINPGDDNGDGWRGYYNAVQVDGGANSFARLDRNGRIAVASSMGIAIAGSTISGEGTTASLNLDYNLYVDRAGADITDTTLRIVIVGHNVDGFASNNNLRLQDNVAMSVRDGSGTYNEVLVDQTFDLSDMDVTGFATALSSLTFDATAYGSYTIGIEGGNIESYGSGAREYLEIDNITVVPEPLGLGALVALLVRRIRA